MSYPPLTAQTLRWLQQLQQRLNASGSERVKISGKAVQQVLSWCIEHELVPGNSLNLPYFTFTKPLLADIAAAQRKLNQACFLDDRRQSRLASAAYSQQELKTVGLQPRQQRVLVKLNTAADTGLGITADIIDTDWQQLPLPQFDALLVVENLDCFYQLAEFQLQLGWQNLLILYRGDKLYSKGIKALKQQWLSSGKPAVYFGDFDAKGVSIALNEGYSAMLLPDFATLQQQAGTAMLPDKQLKFIPAINTKNLPANFQPYLKILQQQKGLRQQNMQALPLQAVGLRAEP